MKQQTEPIKSAEEVEQEFRKKCLGEAGISYSAGVALIVLVSTLFSLIVGASTKFPVDPLTNDPIYPDWYRYLSFLLPQIALFGAALIYFLRTKERVRVVVKPGKWYYFLIALALQLGLMFPVSELNDLLMEGLKAIGYKIDLRNYLPSLEGWNLLPAILVIAVLPAIFEETLFRGILSRNMQNSGWGLVPTIFVAGALFSIYHGRPEQTVYQFISGVCLTLVAVKAGSMLPTILAHFFNNALVLVFASCFGEDWKMPMVALIPVLVVSALLFLGALAFLIFFDKRNNQKGKIKYGKRFFFTASAGIGICVIRWVVALIAGIKG